MSEFNVGDKVRATESLAWGSVPEGKTGVITEAPSDGTVRVDFGPEHRTGDDAWWQNEANLELVDPFPEEGVRYRHSYTGLIYYVEDGKVMVEDPQEGDFQSASTIEDLVRRKSTYTAIVRPVEVTTRELGVDRDLRNNPWPDTVEHNGYHGREAQLHYHIDYNLGDRESRARAKELLAELQPEDTRSEMNQKMDTVREAGERRRQKLIAHTHKLEAVIRDRNAEIDFLRGQLDTILRAALIGVDDLGFVKPSQNN